MTAECAAQSLAALCWSNPGNQQLMGDIGGLRMLIEQLMAGPHSLLSRGASLALAAAMGDNFRNQNIVRDAGGAFVLVDMLRSGPSNPVVIPVLHALGLLVKGHRAAQSEVGEAGGTSALLKLLQSSPGSDVAREAVASLSALTRDHPGNKAAVQRDGGVAILLGFVIAGCQALASRSIALPGAWDKPDPLGALAPFEPDADLPTQLGVVEYSAKTLANLVTGNAAAKVELMECDGVAALIQLQSLAIKAREHWPEGRGWLNAVSGESAAALAALCAGCPETKAEIRDNGGMEALVRGLKIGEDKDAAVEEAACVMRCLIAPAHAFWDGAMSSIIQRKRERSTALQASVTQFYRAEHSMFEQHQALEAMLEVNTDRKAKSQYIWALLHLIADCEENRKELAELYAVGIAPLKLKMEEIAGKTAPASTDLTRRVRSLIGRYCRAAPAAGK